jgi:CubicO group peptidase (beta-lactamase class C family)
VTPQPDLTAAWRLDISAVPVDGPGLVAGVARGGELTSLAMSGRESLGPSAGRLRAATVFYAASLSKQVTAACLAILEAAGSLRLTDSVRRHVRGLPQIFEPVQLGHLLHHTSGIAAARGLGPASADAWWMQAGLDDVVRDLARSGRAESAPGERYRYANEGYWLLAAAIEAAAAQSLAQLADWRLFGPLGMTSSRFRDRPEAPGLGTAIGHEMRDGRLEAVRTDFHVVGDGGLMTTLADLARWDLFWSGRSALGPDLPLRMRRQGTLNDGARLQYAWGVSIRRHRHQEIISHGGEFLGYRGKFVRFPGLDVAVIVLANSDAIDVDGYAMRLADLVLAPLADLSARSWADTLAGDGRAEADY